MTLYRAVQNGAGSLRNLPARGPQIQPLKWYRGNVPGRGTWALGAKMGPVLGSQEIKFAYENAKKTRKTRWIEEGRYFGGKLRPKRGSLVAKSDGR